MSEQFESPTITRITCRDVVWHANIYSNGCVGDSQPSRSHAEIATCSADRIAVLKITIRDGRDVSVEVERV